MLQKLRESVEERCGGSNTKNKGKEQLKGREKSLLSILREPTSKSAP